MKTKNQKQNIRSTAKTILIGLGIALLMAWNLNCFGQDTIVLGNGTIILSKVLEVSNTEIKYKKVDNSDSPIYIESKSEVVMINYKNGTKDEFKFEKPWLVPATKTVEVVPVIKKYPELSKSGKHYFSDNKSISERRIQKDLLSVNNADINYHVRKARQASGFQYIGFAAIPLAFVGTLYCAASDQEGMGRANDNLTIGGTMLGLAAISFGASIRFKVKRSQHNADAIKLYNESY